MTQRPPAHRQVAGTSFVVDYFRRETEGCSAYFLSHGHGDHYGGLSENWSAGPIYCSAVSARFVAHKCCVRESLLRALPLETPVAIEEGATVTLVDANHCPGAVLFIFRRADGVVLLHTGDCRYDAAKFSSSRALEAARVACVDTLYLDTTYGHARHTFPQQTVSVEYVAAAARSALDAGALVLISAYNIGKEQLFEAAAAASGCLVHVSAKKLAALRCLGVDLSIYTTDETKTRLRAVPMQTLGDTAPYFKPNWVSLEAACAAAGASRAVGLVPTGWVHSAKAAPGDTFPILRKGDAMELHLVPYSEHSSCEELKALVRWLRPRAVVPTVGVDGEGGEKERARLAELFRHEIDTSAAKRAFFGKSTAAAAAAASVVSSAAVEPPSVPHAPDCGEEAPSPESDTEEAVEEAHAAPAASPAGREPHRAARVEEVSREASREASRAAAREEAPIDVDATPPSQAGAAASADEQLVASVLGCTLVEAHARLRHHRGNVAAAVNSALDATHTHKAAAPAATKKRPAPPAKASAGGGKRGRTSGGGGGGGGGIRAFFGAPQQPGKSSPAPASPPAKPPPQPSPSQPAPAPPPVKASPQPSPSPSQKAVAAPTIAPAPTVAPATAVAPASSAPPAFTFFPPALLSLPCEKFNPRLAPAWPAGSLAPYAHVAACCDALVSTRSRLVHAATLTNTFRALFALSPGCATPCAWLLTDALVAAWDVRGTGALRVGDSSLVTAIADATGAARSAVSAAASAAGDLGDAAASLRASQPQLRPPPPLGASAAHAALVAIAFAPGGAGAGGRRRDAAASLLRRASRSPSELRFVARTLAGRLRVGACRTTVLAGIAAAAVWHAAQHERGGGAEPAPADVAAAVASVSRAYALCPNLDALVPALVARGPSSLASIRVEFGTPVCPMLAAPSTSMADALSTALKRVRLRGGGGDSNGGGVLAEVKYDGQRCAAHVCPPAGSAPGAIRLFTRSGEECTAAFPDAVAALRSAACSEDGVVPARGAVLDGELVAVRRSPNGGPPTVLPFQSLATRARAGAPAAAPSASPAPEVAVCFFAFDCLRLGDDDLVDKPLSQRRSALASALPGLSSPGAVGRVAIATAEPLDDGGGAASEDGEPASAAGEEEGSSEAGDARLLSRLSSLLSDALNSRNEGLMLKDLGAPYAPGARSPAWVKLKRENEATLRDDWDLVPIAAWRGSGRKAKWLSPFLLAAWDAEAETWRCVCRCLSGFTDEFYARMTTFFLGDGAEAEPRTLSSRPANVLTGESPPFWLEPCVVWTIRGADFQLSPVHTAGAGLIDGTRRGLGLRFPRFIAARDDKHPDDATTPSQLVAAFLAQRNRAGAEEDGPAGEEKFGSGDASDGGEA